MLASWPAWPQHRHVPRAGRWCRSRLRHDKDPAAARHLHRHRPAQHPGHQRHHALPDHPPHPGHPGPWAPKFRPAARRNDRRSRQRLRPFHPARKL